jgi:hypothetical protein
MEKLTLQQAQNLGALAPEDVVSVYSGRPGCACGCRGKYSYHSANRAVGAERRGYAVGDDEVNDRTVAKVLKLVQANADRATFVDGLDGEDIYAFDLHENRTYTVYTRKAGR